ncbi:hypothetical protein ACFPMF_24365 [Larkinella bovis]|uniref:SDR family NAD(P)-dependent oxidoreductase n=1 Tax=Larkinella bovis TaxID=683041 RepID=A0ABW0IG81_9BACT
MVNPAEIMMKVQKAGFVTGASKGIGFEIVKTAILTGDNAGFATNVRQRTRKVDAWEADRNILTEA